MAGEHYHIETDGDGRRFLVTELPRSAWDRASERAGAYAALICGLFILVLYGRFALFAPADAPPDTRTVIILTVLFALPGAAMTVFGLLGLRRPVAATTRERELIDDDLIERAEEYQPSLLPLLLGEDAARPPQP